jgi:Protein of unknown function (DUF1045)
MRVNIAIVPPTEVVSELVASVASRLDLLDTDFVVDGAQRGFHLTLYMGMAPADIADPAHRAELVTLADHLVGRPAVHCDPVSLSLTANGYLEIAYEKTQALLELQGAVVEALAPLMAAASSGPAAVPEAHLSDTERANLARFGYEFVGDQFRPHITVARFSPSASITLPPFERDRYRFLARELAAAQADAAGSAITRLATFGIGTDVG